MKNSTSLFLRVPGMLGLIGMLAGCASWPGLDDPSVTIAPELVLLRVTGQTQMQSNNISQQPQTIQDLGTGKRDEEIGGRIAYGDGFSGFEVDYLRVDMKSTDQGLARHPWGAVSQGEAVNSRLVMDDLRLRYIAKLPWEYLDEDEETWVRGGVGLQLSHREMNFTVREVNNAVAQKIEVKEDASPMLAVRVAGGRGPIDVQFDYAINDDWDFGTGDFDKRFYDFAVRASYYLEAQDITLFGGYRRFDTPSRGTEGTQEYRTDFTFDGLFFGFRFVF